MEPTNYLKSAVPETKEEELTEEEMNIRNDIFDSEYMYDEDEYEDEDEFEEDEYPDYDCVGAYQWETYSDIDSSLRTNLFPQLVTKWGTYSSTEQASILAHLRILISKLTRLHQYTENYIDRE